MAHDNLLPDAIPFRTLGPLSGAVKAVIGVLLLLGFAAAALGLAGGNPYRFWDALLFNWLFWSSLAMGMVVFAAALHITGAHWAWSIRRIALGGVAFLPISFLLFFLLWAASGHYFHHWLEVAHGEVVDVIVQNKLGYLNLPFLLARGTIGLIILYGLAIWFAYLALRPDVYGVNGAKHRPLYDRMTANWRGVHEEVQHSKRRMTAIAPVLALLFAIIWGFIAIDWAMSLDPHFFSTMFPVAFFVTAFHGGIAATAIATTVIRRNAKLEDFITTRQYHDLGKLVFAFSVFWMYINWSQYVVIWYGLLPHEQEWFVHRFVDPFGPFVRVVVVLVFILPFFGLLTRPPKMVPGVLAFFAGLILLGHWFERFMLIIPSLWNHEGFPLGLTEVGMGLGFAGLFLLAYTWYARTFPLLPSPASLAAHEPNVVRVPAPTAARS
jgi:uncharacterized membrane protein YkgB